MAPSVVELSDPLAAPLRRPPLSVLAAAGVGVVEAIALLAVGLTGLDRLLGVASPAHGWLAALTLLLLSAWIVLCAGSGVALLDGTSRRGLVAVSCGELVLGGALLVASAAMPWSPGGPGGLPLPALALLALGVPTGKLLLAGAPSAGRWLAAGPRARERRPDPVATHRRLCAGTLAVIGGALCALALLTPVAGEPDGPAAAVVGQG